MRRRILGGWFPASILVLAAVGAVVSTAICQEAQPIVLGCPLATGFVYRWDAERGIRLAVEEINADGGVAVAGKKRPFK
ncbi:MAG: hypothetical protein ACUVXD_18310, partial [Thermodesulfobacteriota bacterium]